MINLSILWFYHMIKLKKINHVILIKHNILNYHIKKIHF